ncbi:hypothetical protein DFH08DRAFT_993425 [Mycena albidolilacea]|uniref:Uncharacterized protein n=1 Tax=Mycena albidolilacea TaxID=1033008 RepID=A0AAD6YYB5_9AGAR|nr:hypothetical protein DFH08DRAFT_993425 [Mycena albidolilacea]
MALPAQRSGYPVSPRWRDVLLSIGDADLMYFFPPTRTFPFLKKLAIRSIEWLGADVCQFFDGFPALKELTFEKHQLSDLILLPWARLRAFTSGQCDTVNVLRILPLLSLGTRLLTSYGGSETPDLSPATHVRPPRGAIELDCCTNDFVATILGFLTAHSLEELLIRTFHPYSNLAPTILSFLNRSRGPLTSLSLGIPLALDELLSILESPSARAIVHLDISDEEVPLPIGTLCVDI